MGNEHVPTYHTTCENSQLKGTKRGFGKNKC